MTFRLIHKHFSALLREYGRLVNIYFSYGKLRWKFDIAIIKYPKVRCDRRYPHEAISSHCENASLCQLGNGQLPASQQCRRQAQGQ